jgi:hypothetical protein
MISNTRFFNTSQTSGWTRDNVAGFLFGIGLGTAVGYFLRPSRPRIASSGVARGSAQGAGHPPVYSDDRDDIVGRASEESFPASDSPAY